MCSENMQVHKDKEFSQEFWKKNDNKFIIFNNFRKRNEFMEFLRDNNIPMNMFAYYNRNKPYKFEWDMLLISGEEKYLCCKHAHRNDKRMKHKISNEIEFTRLFGLTYYDIYGNHTLVPIKRRKRANERI